MMRVRFDSRWKYLAVDTHPFDIWLFTTKPPKDDNGNYYNSLSSAWCQVGLHARNLYFETIYSLTPGTLYRIINEGTELEEVVERPDLKVDDPVLVGDVEGAPLIPRHFAGWGDDGRILCFAAGQTSFSGKNDDLVSWKCYKLPEVK